MCAVLATITWLFEFDLTNDVIYGTGFGAALIAGAFWFFDLRYKRQERRKQREREEAVLGLTGGKGGPAGQDV